ncbi:DUF5977 domain-containing protein [Chitinophaga nivalis]|uniref:DUF5977 domain-containing protein n=1 Tax=Chitinophaga nivalis TaxID=2991709 RepID=A0ABT3IRQ2_9BACT|nr:DUF5977 domain-containing protein [Chitinophaga nivalis]MCW3463663.1 DUF5977 domain-containing protein [Chitinophaga nivalis]MCW3486647.1 DUF5977 domain-containing protein [Chitinophaga nivalis]
MILVPVAKGKKMIAYVMLLLMYFETVIPAYALGKPARIGYTPVPDKKVVAPVKAAMPPVIPPAALPVAATLADNDPGGPTQPEMQGFHSVNNDNMVDLFTGDFAYSIPLLDVGGYPLTLGYNSGISMDQEASWVGLGWTLNPGAITRNMRGLPDDFNGTDVVTKELSMKDNQTIGATTGFDLEILGTPKLRDGGFGASLGVGASIGVFNNTYRGWGLETAINAGINVGSKSMGFFTSGLSLANNSQEGVTLSPSLGYSMPHKETAEKAALGGVFSISSGYNTRAGMKALQFNAGLRQYNKNVQNTTGKESSLMGRSNSYTFSSDISYAYPGYTPAITIPYSSSLLTVNLRLGFEYKTVSPSFMLSGYVSRQTILPKDSYVKIPAYGYLNFQNGSKNLNGLMDFNREKDVPFREKPDMTNIAVPAYTYDVFSISGEGNGGMFRAYRNDIGNVFDHAVTTKDNSTRAGGDLGYGDVLHTGVDLNFTRSYTESGMWTTDNPLSRIIAFQHPQKDFEAVYFKNPGEKTVDPKAYYDALGGDDLVAAKLFQWDRNSPVISTTNRLTRYVNQAAVGDVVLNSSNAKNTQRSKRTQVISYLTAKEASEAGLSKYIDSYKYNTYRLNVCDKEIPDELENALHGLNGMYYYDREMHNYWGTRVDPELYYEDVKISRRHWNRSWPDSEPRVGGKFSARWEGRLRAPISGRYDLMIQADEGASLELNGRELITGYNNPEGNYEGYSTVFLDAGKMYNVLVHYRNDEADSRMHLKWKYGNMQDYAPIPTTNLFALPRPDSILIDSFMTREQRVNSYRKPDHISEINVLNNDGRRYVYGIPVYNLEQKEATFSVEKNSADAASGLAAYTSGKHDRIGKNDVDNERYYSSETIPAYAHTFLLTGILSPDYVDVNGDGITDDDPGDAIRFNYTKVAGINNPYKWRTPYNEKANYNEGLKTDYRDDKGSYVTGKKELWYLNSVESKNMIAVFRLGDRKDLLQIDSIGVKSQGGAKRLELIDLYTKADFLQKGTKATPIKTVHFEYTHELCMGINGKISTLDSGKLTLKRVWFSYNGNNKGRKNAYVFNYNAKNPVYHTQHYDRWGNYKDPAQNPRGAGTAIINNADYPYALQDSTAAAVNAAAWTLDSIVLPSGGRVKVTYESDDYAYVQNKRAMQFFPIAGFAAKVPASKADLSSNLYIDNQDHLYVAIDVPVAVNSREEIYTRYLEGITGITFRLNVMMPRDKYGGGGEAVPCYAKIDEGVDNYGVFNNGKTIWVKLMAIDKNGNPGGSYSPLTKAAMQFLRLNLPSKAYPGSDVTDSVDLLAGVSILIGMAGNIVNSLRSFDATCRSQDWVQKVDLNRSYIRLNSPAFKKYGGGLRVKRIVTWDNWNSMTGQKEARYGQEYIYTTTRKVNDQDILISSGVASYEPVLGGEENPFRVPVAYRTQVAALAPVTMGYTEEPLGEGFFPAPSVGYSKVRVRSINTTNTRSAPGYDETCFYTAYDFPTITERTIIGGDTHKRFKPGLTNFLRINAKHFLAVSQGFKIELNDMHGKLKSKASYGEANPTVWINKTEHFYRVDDQQATFKHLNNDVLTLDAKGQVNEQASIGKEIELMTDMRQQRSLTNGLNLSINCDIFTFAWPPVMAIPTVIHMAQREENIFRSIAVTKLINRHGILDSIVVNDKGSRVTTRNLLYDGETGEVVLTSTQNEYNDPIYNFTYPAGWVYDGMSGAYKNINVLLQHLDIKGGKIINGLPTGEENKYCYPGDEILIYSHNQVGGEDCNQEIATFASAGKIWAVDKNVMTGGAPDIYFMDKYGVPYGGNDVTLKIIRSGRRNVSASAGGVTMLKSPLLKQANNKYTFDINNGNGIISAAANEFKQLWHVTDRNRAVTSPALFGNDEVGRYFTKDCGPGNYSTLVLYRVPAGTYTAPTRDGANRKAEADMAQNGPKLARDSAVCYYGNTRQAKTFKRNDCPEGTYVDYIVEANKHYATSVAAANALALREIDSLGQKNANEKGNCGYLYAKVTVLHTTTKNDYTPSDIINTRFGNVVVSFYKDEACTLPFNVTNQKFLLVDSIYTRSVMEGNESTSGSLQTVKEYSCTGTSIMVLENVEVEYERRYREWDSHGNEVPQRSYNIDRHRYYLRPSNDFIIK